jgi:acyl-CoA thioesterase
MTPDTTRTVMAFDGCSFAQTLGLRIVTADDSEVTVEMDADGVRNGNGLIHGGAIFALADHAFGAAANLSGEEVALAAEISYLVPADGHLVATARRVDLSPAASLYRVEVRQGDRLVAVFSGHGFRIS